MASLHLIAFIVFITVVSAFPPGPPRGAAPPPFPRDVPPGFEKVLPAKVINELRAIHKNDNLSWQASFHNCRFHTKKQQKHEKIDAIMSALPDELLEKLPLPPGFDKLPKDVQDKLHAVHKERGLNWQQKHEKIHSIIESLPEEQKRLIPPPPPPPGFEKLPKDVQAKLKAVHEDRTLTWHQRHQKIHSIIQSLPEEQRRLLPPPPPPPGFRPFKNFQKLHTDE